MMTEINNAIGLSDAGNTETPALPKSSTITLTAPGATMSIVAERKADGARTYVLMADDKGKNSKRGMSETHATFEAAVAAIAKIASDAVKKGWVRKVNRAGFQPRPDAFSTLPAAPKVKK